MEAALSRAVPNTDRRVMMEFAMDTLSNRARTSRSECGISSECSYLLIVVLDDIFSKASDSIAERRQREAAPIDSLSLER